MRKNNYEEKNNGKNRQLWRFGESSNIEVVLFNGMLENFVKYGLNSLVKENIQNSLDAKLENSVEPVIVKIGIGDIDTKQIPGITEIKNRVNILKSKNEYDEKTIKQMKAIIQQKSSKYISFEDENTIGLSEETWDYYAYKKGAHHFNEDKEFEMSRGGSHGVGKIASNAASDIHMMIFANCDEKCNEYIGGTVQLIDHEYNGNIYRSTGYFTDTCDSDQHKYIPMQNNFEGIFEKKTRGLKIIIPFLKKQYYKEKEIIRAVCDNFFLAILENKLKVHIKLKSEQDVFIIDKNTINGIVNDEEYYNEKIRRTNFTPEYIATYLHEKPIGVVIKDKKKNEYNFNLYFRYDEELNKGRTAIIRTIGMKIEDYIIDGKATKPYNAVLIPKSSKEDAFLKSLENESHRELTHENIRDYDERRNALNFINNIGRKVEEYIQKEIERLYPTDGNIDTKDLLYSVENQFRKSLENNTTRMTINNPRTKQKQQIVKRTNIIKNKKRTISSSEIRETTKRNIQGKTRGYLIQSDSVRRIVSGNTETLSIDLSSYPQFSNKSWCNIFIKLIDGQGRTSFDTLDLVKYYDRVEGLLDRIEYNLEDNCILKVPMENEEINLEMEILNNVNSNLKFEYYLEVL